MHDGKKSAVVAHPKEHRPKDSAEAMAAAMGIALLTEEEYRHLQQQGEFDTTTSSWVKTPAHVRRKGGALFCDRRYDKVFVYHSGAESNYAARGIRGAPRIWGSFVERSSRSRPSAPSTASA
jgi:hypothetical protein